MLIEHAHSMCTDKESDDPDGGFRGYATNSYVSMSLFKVTKLSKSIDTDRILDDWIRKQKHQRK